MADEGVSHEEICSIPPVSQAYCAVDKVKIGKKKITFHASRYSHSIAFERGVAHTGRPDFGIEVMEVQPVFSTCSLGHKHETGKTERRWTQLQLSWEMAEAFVEWFQAGDFHKVREAAKRERERFEEFKKKDGA